MPDLQNNAISIERNRSAPVLGKLVANGFALLWRKGLDLAIQRGEIDIGCGIAYGVNGCS